MKRTQGFRLVVSMGLIVLGMVVFAANPAGAATTAAGPYYPTPSWDQQLPASTRFVVLSNWIDAAHPSGGAAVLDRETGLVWEQSPTTSTFVLGIAQFHCIKLNVGGRTGWRLPTIQELMSLEDPSLFSLPSGHPFSNPQAFAYWSATSNLADSSFAYAMNFSGFVSSFPTSISQLSAWCVRGGQGVGSQ